MVSVIRACRLPGESAVVTYITDAMSDRYNTNQHKKPMILWLNQSKAVPVMFGPKLQHPRRIQAAVLPQSHLG